MNRLEILKEVYGECGDQGRYRKDGRGEGKSRKINTVFIYDYFKLVRGPK